MPRRYTEQDIAGCIDHSILAPNATLADVEKGVRVGLQYGAASCCVRPCDVPVAAEILRGARVKVCTVIGFPHGTTTTATKVAEAKEAIDNGATEVDMVLNVSRLRSGTEASRAFVLEDVRAVVEASHAKGALVKVILETAYLTDEDKVAACMMCEEAGADFVKTSTGFASSGATVPDLQLMSATVSSKVQVKASGGIRTLDALLDALAAGASRIGMSATEAIVQEFRKRTAETGGVLEVADVAPASAGAGAGAAAAVAPTSAPGSQY
jgi:deoxyribose-phosphate aldolase